MYTIARIEDAYREDELGGWFTDRPGWMLLVWESFDATSRGILHIQRHLFDRRHHEDWPHLVVAQLKEKK